MADILIPLTMTITPGNGSQAATVRLCASGETVFDGYEHSLTGSQKELVIAVTAAHSRLIGKFSQKLDGK